MIGQGRKLPPPVPDGKGVLGWPSKDTLRVFEAVETNNIDAIVALWNDSPQAKTDWTPNDLLQTFAENISAEMARWLLSIGADPNAEITGVMRLIHKFARHNRLDIIKILLECGADVNVRNSIGETPLGYLIHNGNEAGIDLLLEHGADPLLRAGLDQFPIVKAVSRKQIGIYRRLRRSVGDKCDFEVAVAAIDFGQWEILREVLEGLRYNSWSADGPEAYRRSLVHVAATCADPLSAFALLDPRPEDLNWISGDRKRETPLISAARMGNKKGVEELLARGADVRLQDDRGMTAEDLAHERGDIDIERLFE